jgi:hypothetical protein
MSHRPAEPTDDDVARALRHSLDALAPSEHLRQQDLAATRRRRRTRASAIGLASAAVAAVAAVVMVPIVSTPTPSTPSTSSTATSVGASSSSPAANDDIYIAVDDGVEAVVISVSGG